jgi:4-amino-4-deoxy-L-arabinose transferase-like glycosyltransferase
MVTRTSDQFVFILLTVCSAIFLWINGVTLYDGHNWGDDFSQYIQFAKNLVAGDPYHHTYNLDQHVTYPPGYPFILVPLIKWFGVDYRVLKVPNLIFWVLTVWLLYDMLRRRMDRETAFLGACVLFSSPFFFWFKQNVLSDIPFCFFVTATLYCWESYEEKRRKGESGDSIFLWLTVLFMGYAFLIRFVGLALFAGLGVYVIASKADKRLLTPFAAVAIAVWLIHKGMGASGAYHWEEVVMPVGEWFGLSLKQMALLMTDSVNFFFSLPTRISVPLMKGVYHILNWLAPFLFLIFVIWVGIRLVKRRATLIDCFVLVYMMLMSIWWIDGGERYVLPLIGPAVFYFGGFVQWVAGKMQKAGRPVSATMLTCAVFGVLFFHNILSIRLNFNFYDDDIHQPPVQELVNWINANTAADDRLMFQRMRVMGVLTERYVAGFLEHPKDRQWGARIERLNIHYLVMTRGVNEFILNWLDFDKVRIRPIWENEHYRIYEVF